MKLRIALITVLLIAAFSALTGRASAQSAAGGKLRFLHALPEGPAVDVFIDNTLAARNLEFTKATRYLNVASGQHTVVVTATGIGAAPNGTPIIAATISISPDKVNQLIVVGGTPTKPEAAIYPQELGPAKLGSARITAIHAVKDGPPVDILRADGSPLINGLKYGEVFGEVDIPAASPELAVVPAGGELAGALIKPVSVSLDAGTHTTIVAVGTLEGKVKPSYVILTAPLAPNTATDVLVRFANLINAGRALDLYVNGQLIVTGLNFKKASEHIALPTGESKIELRSSGDTATTAAASTLSLVLDSNKDKALTAVISGNAVTGAILRAYPDNVSALDPATARINLINLLGAPATLTVDGKPLIADAAVDQPAANGEIARGVYRFELAIAALNVSIKGNLTVNGGTLSGLIVGGSDSKPELILATTGLSEAAGSVPVNTTPNALPVVAAAPTATLAPVATTAPIAPVAPAAPTEPSIVNTPRPTAVKGVTGTVITNDGVNLKIREYPRTDAKTLALIPSGSPIKILGVKGPNARTATAPAFGTKDVKTPTIVATSRADVWIFIEWTAPDGGVITGWTIAQYVDISVNGYVIRRDNIVDVLAFAQIPDDQFGTSESAGSTPIPPDDKRTIGTVTTLVGTNAQLRRTPSVKGESLALVPSGGFVYILGKTDVPVTGEVGEPKSSVWFNVQFDVEGSSVIGWMSADFLKLSIKYNGQPVDVKDVPVITDIEPGLIRGNATQVIPPAKPGIVAQVILIDANANLQLRRDPNQNAESLGLIPGQTEVEVVGRNGAGSWVQVTFNGQTGWANANFLRVTKSGKLFPVKDIKITNDEPDTFGTTTPTTTPVGVG